MPKLLIDRMGRSCDLPMGQLLPQLSENAIGRGMLPATGQNLLQFAHSLSMLPRKYRNPSPIDEGSMTLD